MFLENCEILENKQIYKNYYLMKLCGEKAARASLPGQFFMLQTKNQATLLRRPISLHSADKEKNIIEFYYEVKGSGTKEFSNLREGELLNIQGPLGTGFSTEEKEKTLVVVGGGMGIAPMKYLIETLKKENKIIFICGGRDKNALEILENIDLENVKTFKTTDDGSDGIKGNVTIPLKEILEERKIDKVYTCGPSIMMKFVAKLSEENNVPCEVSLEERMACGIKACVGCSILTKDGMKKVCHDGPVFKSDIIIDANPEDRGGGCCGK